MEPQMLEIEISLTILINKGDLLMHHMDTGEIKPYSKIEGDKKDWIVYKTTDAINEASEVTFEAINIVDDE